MRPPSSHAEARVQELLRRIGAGLDHGNVGAAESALWDIHKQMSLIEDDLWEIQRNLGLFAEARKAAIADLALLKEHLGLHAPQGPA